jgi:hypothetical protein
VAILLTDARRGAASAGLLCLLVSERPEPSTGLCTIEARDRRGSAYGELASSAIVELDALTPGVADKRNDSALMPDPAPHR